MDADIIGNRCAETLIRLQIHFLPPPPPSTPQPLQQITLRLSCRCSYRWQDGAGRERLCKRRRVQIPFRLTYWPFPWRINTQQVFFQMGKRRSGRTQAPTDEIKIKRADRWLARSAEAGGDVVKNASEPLTKKTKKPLTLRLRYGPDVTLECAWHSPAALAHPSLVIQALLWCPAPPAGPPRPLHPGSARDTLHTSRPAD